MELTCWTKYIRKNCGLVICLLLVVRAEVEATFYGGGGFTFEIGDGEKMCLHQEFAENGQRWVMESRVVRGGNNDIDILITNSRGIEIFEKEKAHIEKFEFESAVGTFEFCFSNEFSKFRHKQVFVHIYPNYVESLVEAAGGQLVPRAETQLENAMENIHGHMSKVGILQLSTKNKNRLGFNTAVDLNTTVSWTAIFYMVAIIVTGFGQVMALKKLFPTNKNLAIKPDGKEVTYTSQYA